MRRKVKRLVKGLLSPFRPDAGARTAAKAPTRQVWRMTEDDPKGAWVDPQTADTMPAALQVDPLDHGHSSGWLTSSMDLLSGAEISEYPHPVHDSEADRTSEAPPTAPAPKGPRVGGNDDA